MLWHGRNVHGLQFVDPLRAAWPTTYYSEKSGVGLALRALPAAAGASAWSAWAPARWPPTPKPGDDVHFYEINPEVLSLAASRFTYLTNCPGKVEVTLGDARLSLEREPPQDFDLLVLDAFNSDAIPVHLLTREAFAIYGRHLKTNGIIAVHISNRSLNLEPVVINLARHFNYQVAAIDDAASPPINGGLGSVWMLLSRSGEIIDSPAIRLAARPPQTNSVSIPLWTDDFTSLFQMLRSETGPQTLSGSSEAQTKSQPVCGSREISPEPSVFSRRNLKTRPDSPICSTIWPGCLPPVLMRRYATAPKPCDSPNKPVD